MFDIFLAEYNLIVFIFRVQAQTPQSHPHVQNPASAHHQVKDIL